MIIVCMVSESHRYHWRQTGKCSVMSLVPGSPVGSRIHVSSQVLNRELLDALQLSMLHALNSPMADLGLSGLEATLEWIWSHSCVVV
jgi:hypothetical protein